MSSLEIDLESGTGSFRPGGTLRGTARWVLATRPQNVQLRLLWHTQGKGTQDVEVVASESFSDPGQRGSREFRFVLPVSPYSFSGQLISLTWALELIAGDEVMQKNFVVAPAGNEILLDEAGDGAE